MREVLVSCRREGKGLIMPRASELAEMWGSFPRPLHVPGLAGRSLELVARELWPGSRAKTTSK